MAKKIVDRIDSEKKGKFSKDGYKFINDSNVMLPSLNQSYHDGGFKNPKERNHFLKKIYISDINK